MSTTIDVSRPPDSVRQRVIVALNPDHALAIVCENGAVVADSTPNGGYIGMSETNARLAMILVMRYEDGTEKNPNTCHSANGYATIIEVDGVVGQHRWAMHTRVTI